MKSTSHKLPLQWSTSYKLPLQWSTSSQNDMGPTVSFHNFTQLTHFELKGCLLKSLLHLATAEPACSIPTQHMSINQVLSENHKMEGTVWMKSACTSRDLVHYLQYCEMVWFSKNNARICLAYLAHHKGNTHLLTTMMLNSLIAYPHSNDILKNFEVSLSQTFCAYMTAVNHVQTFNKHNEAGQHQQSWNSLWLYTCTKSDKASAINFKEKVWDRPLSHFSFQISKCTTSST